MSDAVAFHPAGNGPAGEPPSARKIRRVESLVAAGVVLLGWFACILGAASELYWLGPAVVIVLAGLHCAYSVTWLADLRLMLVLAGVGTALDSAQSILGFLTFYGRPESWPAWLAPPWITALWLHFGTLRWPLFRPLARRPGLAAGLGAVAAPLAYWAGARLDAAAFGDPAWRTFIALAVVWAVLLPVAARWTWRRVP